MLNTILPGVEISALVNYPYLWSIASAMSCKCSSINRMYLNTTAISCWFMSSLYWRGLFSEEQCIINNLFYKKDHYHWKKKVFYTNKSSSETIIKLIKRRENLSDFPSAHLYITMQFAFQNMVKDMSGSFGLNGIELWVFQHSLNTVLYRHTLLHETQAWRFGYNNRNSLVHPLQFVHI